MSENRKNYIPALSYDFLTPLYDPLIRLALRESVFKTALLKQASVQPGTRALDLACGTGTLAIMAKKACPQAEIVGLDGDAKILEIARTKARGENVAVRFDEAFSTALPYEDDSFDCVISSLFFITSTAKTNGGRCENCAASSRRTASCTSPIGVSRKTR